MEEIKSIKKILYEIDYSEESFIKALNLLSKKDFLIQIIDQVLLKKKILNQIAIRSYNHPNGFYKILLFSEPDYKLRLHIWYPSKGRQQIENIHYHRWEFYSKIILGQYTCHDFELNVDGESMHSYYYYPRGGRNSYQIVKRGNEKLKLVQSRILKPGDILISKPKELHRVIYDGSIYTASLFIQGKDELKYTVIYNENSLRENIVSKSIDANELFFILEKFRNEISFDRGNEG